MLTSGATEEKQQALGPSVFHLFINKYLMRPYYVRGTALVAEGASKNQTNIYV